MTDPLNISIPLAGVETDFPLIPVGDYPLQISESQAEANKDRTGFNWKITLQTTQPITSPDGREVKVGTKLFVYCALQPKADADDKEGYIRALSSTIDGILGTDKTNRPNFDAALVKGVLGKMVVGHVTIEQYQGKNNNKVQVKGPVQ